MEENKKWIFLGVILIAAFILYRTFASGYNTMVNYDETVITAWSNVENVYQRSARYGNASR